MEVKYSITKQIDELGRLVVPIEIRRAYGIGHKGKVEIFMTNEGILLRSAEATAK